MAKRTNIPPATFLRDQFHVCRPGQGRKQRHLVLAAQIGSSLMATRTNQVENCEPP
jgi:hypothetical protein